jgi:hypothetical protein
MLNKALDLSFLYSVLWLAIFIFAVTELVRALFSTKALSKLGLAERKPIACNLCMAFWVSVAVGLYQLLVIKDSVDSTLLYQFPAFALGLITLRKFGKRGGAPLP